MSAKVYVVRIVQTEGCLFDNIPPAFIECLRYAGLAIVHETDPDGLTKDCFDLVSPEKDSKSWATRNAERIRSFGYNAVCAPSTV